MCVRSKEAIGNLLNRAPDRQTRRTILEELSACGECKFGKVSEVRQAAVICERHLVEFRNMVIHHAAQCCLRDMLKNSASNEPGEQ